MIPLVFRLLEKTNESHTWFAIELSTQHCDGEPGSPNTLHVAIGKYGWYWEIPNIIDPKGFWVSNLKGELIPDYVQRSYGFAFNEEACHVHYGIQPGSWSRDDPENSDHVKVLNYPWNYQHVRWDCYYTDGERASSGKYFRKWEWEVNNTKPFNKDTYVEDFQTVSWFRFPNAAETDFSEVETDKPVYQFFAYRDPCDKTDTVARVNIEEREWIRGKWKWLRAILKHVPGCRMIQRSLYVTFRDPVGGRKDTWKGGIRGMGIPMLPGQTITDAWSTFVAKNETL